MRLSELERLSTQLACADYSIHQTPVRSFARVDQLASEQHLESALAPDGATESYHRCGAETARS